MTGKKVKNISNVHVDDRKSVLAQNGSVHICMYRQFSTYRHLDVR